MSKLTAIRSKLANKIFTTSTLGTTLTITPTSLDNGSYGGYELQTETEGTSFTTVGVPYNLIYSNINYQPFGDLLEGEMDIILQYNISINIDDKVSFGGIDYRVKKIENIPLNDGIVAKIIRVVKEQ